MKKGLRHSLFIAFSLLIYSNKRPDEEGIKTPRGSAATSQRYSNKRPDEEGIKTESPPLLLSQLPFKQET